MPQAGASVPPDGIWSEDEWRGVGDRRCRPGPRAVAGQRPPGAGRFRLEARRVPPPARASRPPSRNALRGVWQLARRRRSRPAAAVADGTGVPGRRTVTITGPGRERNLLSASPRAPPAPAERADERAGFKPDRVAMWAVLLGVLLVLVAAISAHAATLVTLSGH